MLTKCPECMLQVSDKASTCPHCGYPLKGKEKKKKSGKIKRLPNGFGQISELKNQNIRKPFRAMITVGKTEYGRPICKLLKPISYFETYNDAYQALVEYHKTPYDMSNDIYMQELYNRWGEGYFKTLESDSSIRSIKCAWDKIPEWFKKASVKTIKAGHLKELIENINTSANQKSRIKSLLNLLYDYAMEYEIVDRNYARTFNLSKNIIVEMDNAYRGHIIFSDEEMNILWQNTDQQIVRIILIQCYSGWRPQELGNIILDDVDLEKWTFKGGMKTDAGKNRVVPISSIIRELVLTEYNSAKKSGCEYLFNTYDSRRGQKLTYDKYQKRFGNIIGKLGLNPEHRAHDGRKHFVSLCKKYNVDEYAIKYMIGHSINDLTESVYTTRPENWLHTEIEKIKR